MHASWPLVGNALLGIWPSRHTQRSNRLLFSLVWGKRMHFWNSFSGFVFALLFFFFFSPGLMWIFLAVLTVLKITLHISMKTSGKTLAIVTSVASGKKPKNLWTFFLNTAETFIYFQWKGVKVILLVCDGSVGTSCHFLCCWSHPPIGRVSQMLLWRPSLPFAAGNLLGGEDNITKQRLTLQNSSAASGAVWSITDQ